MKDQIKNLLIKFQEGYDKKDIDNVDQYMKEIFSDENDISILGTSEGELCLDYESCRKLITDDWKYWGFESLKIEEAIVQELEQTIVYVPASFSFLYQDNDSNRLSHFNDIIEMISDTSKDNRDIEIKLSEINYELVHIYHKRHSNNRKYRYDLRLIFILNKDYKINQINFSVPDNIKRPDYRIYPNSQFNRSFEYEINKLKSKKKEEPSNDDHDIRNFLKQTFNDYFNNQTLENFDDKNLLYVNVDDKVATNTDDLKTLINYQHQYWNYLTIRDEEAYIVSDNTQATVVAKVIAHSTVNRQEYFKYTQEEILKLKDNSSLTIEEKMFKIKQLITVAFKETSIGEKFEHPLRVQIYLTKQNNQWKINYISMSYLFYYLLEGRNEFMYQVD